MSSRRKLRVYGRKSRYCRIMDSVMRPSRSPAGGLAWTLYLFCGHTVDRMASKIHRNGELFHHVVCPVCTTVGAEKLSASAIPPAPTKEKHI